VNKEKLQQSFGQALFNAREKSGLTQKQLADDCNMERRHITALENGQKQPTLLTIFKLAEYLQIQPGDLLNDAASILRKARRN
jgi:transcriptional regulator with XRE-family HTH domain